MRSMCRSGAAAIYLPFAPLSPRGAPVQNIKWIERTFAAASGLAENTALLPR